MGEGGHQHEDECGGGGEGGTPPSTPLKRARTYHSECASMPRASSLAPVPSPSLRGTRPMRPTARSTELLVAPAASADAAAPGPAPAPAPLSVSVPTSAPALASSETVAVAVAVASAPPHVTRRRESSIVLCVTQLSWWSCAAQLVAPRCSRSVGCACLLFARYEHSRERAGAATSSFSRVVRRAATSLQTQPNEHGGQPMASPKVATFVL